MSNSTTPTARLGGRLALRSRESLSEDAQLLFDELTEKAVPWADRAGFQSRTNDGRLVGPFNPSLLHPAVTKPFLELQFTEQRETSLSARAHEVVILTVGAVWGSAYELYAHQAVARQAGLAADAIRTLAAGGLPDGLADDEQVAQRVAYEISANHSVDDETYADAEAVIGQVGILDVVMLVGLYHTVCGILETFAIPAPA